MWTKMIVSACDQCRRHFGPDLHLHRYCYKTAPGALSPQVVFHFCSADCFLEWESEHTEPGGK